MLTASGNSDENTASGTPLWSVPRSARLVQPGLPHHVTQRGNERKQVFFTDADRRFYLDLIADRAPLFGVQVWAWCLMIHHVHWVVVPAAPTALARLFGYAHGEYARYRNRLRRTVGHLWQARFFSCPLDDAHLWPALAYVERNPVRAGIVSAAEHYVWSSARARLGLAPAGGVPLEQVAWQRRWTPEQWRAVLATSLGEEAFARRWQEATALGRALAGPDATGPAEAAAQRASAAGA